MTIESSRLQIPTAAPNPVLNVQNEIKKGVNKEEQSSISISSVNKQVLTSNKEIQQPKQRQNDTTQISNGRVDIKI